VIGRLIPQTEIDTVVHNQIVRQPGGGVAARAMHDINVIGTLQLLAACEQSPTIEAVVVRGSAGIYGAEPTAPQFYSEEMARLFPLRTRFQRDIGEIENYFEAYSRRHSRVCCTMLRYQPAIGPGTDSQVTRYLSAPFVQRPLGFDARLQFLHEADGREPPGGRNPARDQIDGSVPPLGPAIALLRRLREGIERGPIAAPGAAVGAMSAFPREAREALDRALERVGGDYDEDEWGFDEEF